MEFASRHHCVCSIQYKEFFGRVHTLGGTASRASVAAHGDSHGLLGDVLKVDKSLAQLHTVDGLSGLTGVLEADTKVRAASASALGVFDLLGGVTDLYIAQG